MMEVAEPAMTTDMPMPAILDTPLDFGGGYPLAVSGPAPLKDSVTPVRVLQCQTIWTLFLLICGEMTYQVSWRNTL